MSEYFDATDLDQWAERRDAQGTLPQLVRRLILESADTVHRLQFRSDEGVQLGGWDGIAEVSGTERLVPNGLSVWEVGTNADPRRKAEEDYQLRLQDPLGIDPAQATYVAVTARRFPNKQQWADSKADRPWNAVRVLDADDLATWLDDAPATDAWMASKLGRHPESLEPLTLWWETWRSSTNPELTGQVVLSGRDPASETLLDALDGVPSTIVLASDSTEEGLAFVAATLERDDAPHSQQRFARALVVHDLLGWRRAVASPRPTVLIPQFEGADVGGALGAGHHVIVLTGRARGASENVLDIGRIRREPAREALIAMGLSIDEADRLAGTARGSLMSLRRSLAIAGAVRTPPWAQGEAAQSLLPVLFGGSWHDQTPGDRDVMARLSDTPYEELARHAARWASEGDPPVRLVGLAWRVASIEDIWRLLKGQITAEDLRRFQEVCRDVFLVADPAFELPVEERWLAAVRGADRPHSESLRRGLANSLALIGARYGSTTFSGGSTGQEIATSIVHAVLNAANEDASGNLWASNSDVLLQFAEAAPEAFLDAVETGTTGDTPVLAMLYTDAEGTSPMFVDSAHTGLLWALEALAWSREYLGRVTRVLARLIRIDPGGTLTNRPGRSLREIYMPWHPQTSASLAERFEVIDSLLEREPAEMRAMLFDLLPSGHESAIGTQRPLWRDWAQAADDSDARAEWPEAIGLICERLLALAATEPLLLNQLVPRIYVLPKDPREDVFRALEALDPTQLDDATRSSVGETVRAEAARHRRFANARWVMPTDHVARLEAIHELLAPDDPVETSVWLFGHHHDLPKEEDWDWQRYHVEVDAARQAAVSSVYQAGGLAAVARLGDRAEIPGEVGRALGLIGVPADEEEAILEFLHPGAGPRRWIGRGYVHGVFRERGWEWATEVLETHGAELSSEQQSEFLLALPASGQTWEWLDRFGEAPTRLYWTEYASMGLPDPSEAERAAQGLLTHGRPFAALDSLGLYVDRADPPLDPEFVADALEAAATSPTEEVIGQSAQYDVARLLDHLECSGAIADERLVELEWLYLPLLRYSERPPRLLHRELAREPSFFADVVCHVYRGEAEEPDADPESQARARVAYELLDSWHGLPGVDGEGVVNQDALRDWVLEARTILQDQNRPAIGDQCIGHVLRYAPNGVDGAWPHEVVRNLVEELQSQQIEKGIETEVANSRGVTSRGVFEGGDQERALAQQYRAWAETVQTRWPRTAAMLRRIAEHYEWEARLHDDDAERHEDG
jgi:hypothetical protein